MFKNIILIDSSKLPHFFSFQHWSPKNSSVIDKLTDKGKHWKFILKLGVDNLYVVIYVTLTSCNYSVCSSSQDVFKVFSPTWHFEILEMAQEVALKSAKYRYKISTFKSKSTKKGWHRSFISET